MYTHENNKIITSLLAISITSTFLVACDSKNSNKSAIKVPVQTYKQVKALQISVVDAKGAVTDADIKVTSSSGDVIVKAKLDNSKHVTVEVPAGTVLPLILQAKPKGSSEKLQAVIISTAISKYEINPLTTSIAKEAKKLGGYTYGNMVIAAGNTVGVPEANKTSTGFRGDPTKQYGGWH